MTLQQRFALHPKGAKMLAPASYPTTTIDILLLRVEFQEEPSPSAARVTGSGLWSDPTYSYQNDPDYRLKSAATNFAAYWSEVSYGLLPIAITISPAIYRLPHKMIFYGSESNGALENLIYDSITTASSDTNPATRPVFSGYDAVLIVHAGAGEESDVDNDSPNDLWSLYYSGDCISPDASGVGCLTTLLKPKANGDPNPITEAILMPQTDSQDGYTIDPLGVYVHEFGHWLGLPDLYCTAGSFCPLDGVGKWSLMGDGIYNTDPAACPAPGPDCLYGSSPAHLDAWSKVRLGWAAPRVAASGIDLGPVTMNPVEATGDIIKVQASSTTSSEYFLLENRQNAGYDKGLPGHGLLIWHVDDVVVNNTISSNSINNNAFNPGIRLVEADDDGMLMSYGCAQPDDCGSTGDPFPGSTDNRAFTLHTAPASRSFTPSAWVSIRNIAEIASSATATSITADIGFAPFPPGMPGMHANIVSWPPDTGADVSGYQVYKNGRFIAFTASASFADTEAQNGDQYRITTVDTGNNESDFSGLVTANMALAVGAGGSSRCFIATAAYGSPLDPHVEALRDFRDRVLLKSGPGRTFVAMYYAYSPPVAGFISRHDSARVVVRWILTPMVFGVEYPWLFLMLVCLGFATIFLTGRKLQEK